VETILEVIGWLTITIGTTIAAGLLALLIYTSWSNKAGNTTAVIIISAGFIAGAFWATRIWIKHGTIAWLSRIRRIS